MAFFLCILSACQTRSGRDTVIVFSAASLSDTVREVGSEFSLALQSGGSTTLVAQLAAGAEADILVLADESLVNSVDPSRIEATRTLATNRLVVARRAGDSQASLLDPETTLAVADPRTAPLGVYTEEALPVAKTKARRVLLKDATGVAATLESGHARLGVLYRTDLDPSLEMVEEIAPERHRPIRYVAVLLKPSNENSRRLFGELFTPRSDKLFRQRGFAPPDQVRK